MQLALDYEITKRSDHQCNVWARRYVPEDERLRWQVVHVAKHHGAAVDWVRDQRQLGANHD